MSQSESIDIEDILNKLKDGQFIKNILDRFQNALDQMNIIGRRGFCEYDELVEKVNEFKKALLSYVLDSISRLEVLKDNFITKKYQQDNDLNKARFIKSTLDNIDKQVLKSYLIQCIDLINLIKKLKEKYGGTLFLIEYIILNLIYTTFIGTVLGAIVGVVLPWALLVETAVGGIFGFYVGIATVGYKLTKN
ncbi:hypothetical protein I4U23_021763 [Adineta vaga]|nr:hypothetical protein I4U23_021763 [Adineta vaga]